LGIQAINGIQSTYLGVQKMVTDPGAILEIGGEHAKFIRLTSGRNGRKVLKDFFMNSVCSAGTGSFLEQEAHRLNLTIEEFSRLASLPTQHVRVAGRCAVFAKTDVVHLHQNGISLRSIAYSLCRAIIQNVCNELILSRKFDLPLVFVGGVAANIGIHKALRDILKLDEYSLLVPEDHIYSGVLGAFLASKPNREKNKCSLDEAIIRLKKGPEKSSKKRITLQSLNSKRSESSIEKKVNKSVSINPVLSDLTIGVDIGSTSTNVVCITSDGGVAASITLPTQGRALTAVFKGLAQLREKLGFFQPRAVGVTGSGRKLVAIMIGADAVLNEITAHYLGGSHFFEAVDTIFDIGGQDSKYIRIENGSVSHFAMNKVCSAGTGSFLEEVSELLGLRIKGEFAEEAMSSLHPVDLGERCTVFMATELMRKLQEGEKREDLAAGLSYAVIKNYLSKVVGRNSVGKYISFQGGVASNPAIVSALENVLQKHIHVHEYHEIAGALGVALFALRRRANKSKFRGFDSLDLQSLEMQTFACGKCANNCWIHSISDSAGKRFYSGGLCERYEEKVTPLEKTQKKGIDPFEEREKFLTKHIHQVDKAKKKDYIGIPRALLFYDLIPFWATFFNQLGIDYKFSEPTSRETVHRGASCCPTNPCLPLKTAYGHCLDLLDAGVRRIFIPSVANMSFLTTEERLNHICPASQAWPFTAKSLFSDRAEFLTPTFRFALPHLLKQDIVRFGESLGRRKREVLSAFDKAIDAQNEFFESITQVGRTLLSQDHNTRCSH
jgi:predicted CoA-substrate-specific enzyme activase